MNSMNPVALIAMIIVFGLWFVVASAFLIYGIIGIVGALRDSRFFDQPDTKPTRRK